MSLIESKTMCFGLLLIVNDIGDARETLPSPLWLKNKVMVRKAEGNTHKYHAWAFICTHEGKHRHWHAGPVMDVVREIVSKESGDIVSMYQYTKSLYIGKIPDWADMYGRAWQSHFKGRGGQPITRDLWLLSKTGKKVQLTSSCHAPSEVYAQACSNVCVAMLIILHR